MLRRLRNLVPSLKLSRALSGWNSIAKQREIRLLLERLEDRSLPATFTVLNNLNSGVGSLRQAVLDANSAVGADQIVFANNVTGTISLTTGQLSVTETVTVTGPGADVLSVSGGGLSRVLNLSLGVTLTLTDLTLASGTADLGGSLNVPAGATANLTRVSVESSTAFYGGGIYAAGTLTLTASTVWGRLLS